jgi:hypothetical protein
MPAIYITERDLEALARLAYQEAASMAHDTGDLKAYGSIAEAVLNRAMSGQNYLGRSDLDGINISGVINKRKQFTPVTPVGTREKLPPAPPEVKEAIRQHLADLQQGKSSYVGKRTHYFNPNVKDTEYAKKTWGRGYDSWLPIGTPPNVHYFGSPDPVSV